jgi:CAAX amino terminal protease family protein
MFYRTGSIIPGFVLHWVNNTIVYVVANLMPGFEDASLSQLSNGRPIVIALYIVFSLCILMPALVQLNMRMGENRGK